MINDFSIKSGRVKNNTKTIWGHNGLTHSPMHENFYDQIEPGIQSLVKALIDKNYMTISSCEGHLVDRDPPHIIIATPDLSHANNIKNRLKTYLVDTEVSDRFSKIEVDSKIQVQGTNHNYFRTYEKYYYVNIFICDFLFENNIIFSNQIANIVKRNLLRKINALPISEW